MVANPAHTTLANRALLLIEKSSFGDGLLPEHLPAVIIKTGVSRQDSGASQAATEDVHEKN
jgi:hypothetical protein